MGPVGASHRVQQGAHLLPGDSLVQEPCPLHPPLRVEIPPSQSRGCAYPRGPCVRSPKRPTWENIWGQPRHLQHLLSHLCIRPQSPRRVNS